MSSRASSAPCPVRSLTSFAQRRSHTVRSSTLSLKQLADGADDAEAQALRETIAAQARDASPSPDSLASDDEARHARSRRGARARGHEDSHSDAGSSHGGDARWARRRGPRKGAGDGFNDAVSSPRSPRSPRHGLNMSGYTVPGRDSPRRRRMLRIPAGAALARACARVACAWGSPSVLWVLPVSAEPTQAEQVWVSVRLRPEQPVDRDTGRVSVIAPSRCVYVQVRWWLLAYLVSANQHRVGPGLTTVVCATNSLPNEGGLRSDFSSARCLEPRE